MRLRYTITALPLLFVSVSVSADPAPWEVDQNLLRETQAALSKDGVLSIGARADQIERAIANPTLSFTVGDTRYVMTDGLAETIVALAPPSKDRPSGKITAIANPYPMMALYLGSYYDETGKFDDAVRVLSLGLKDTYMAGVSLGETQPFLHVERGEALNQLKRWDDAIADFDEGLKRDTLPAKIRAHLLRGRGYTYTEMKKIDEAEADYRQSLTFDPGNPAAEHELEYIAQLKAGRPATQGGLAPLQPKTTPSPAEAPAKP